MAMSSFHHDLQETAVIESLPLRHILQSQSPGHVISLSVVERSCILVPTLDKLHRLLHAILS